MLFRLVVEKNGKRSKVVELRADSARIGRAHGNEVRIPSADVSRRHCLLREDDGLLKVEDLESINGTYLNGDLITGEAVVRPGDRLEVGPVQFVIEYELTPDAVQRLRGMDYEVVEESGAEVIVPAEEEVAGTVLDAEEVPEEEVLEVEEVPEEEDVAPRHDLENMKWAPSEEGDLRDLLSHLDEGQESLMPRKRPGPRPRKPAPGDDPDKPTKPKAKAPKPQRRPEDE